MTRNIHSIAKAGLIIRARVPDRVQGNHEEKARLHNVVVVAHGTTLQGKPFYDALFIARSREKLVNDTRYMPIQHPSAGRDALLCCFEAYRIPIDDQFVPESGQVGQLDEDNLNKATSIWKRYGYSVDTRTADLFFETDGGIMPWMFNRGTVKSGIFKPGAIQPVPAPINARQAVAARWGALLLKPKS